MDGNEKLPEGWTKVQSKSRPEKVYFYNKALGVSLWKIEDLKKFDHLKLKSAKRPSPTKPAAMTIQKATSGVASESKVIKKNGAKERLAKLQKQLKQDIVKQERGKQPDPAKIPRQQTKLPEVAKTRRLEKPKTIPEVKSSKEKKNVAAQRMKMLKTQLKTEEEDRKISKKQEFIPTSSKSKVPIKFIEKKVETKNDIPPKRESEDVEMMDVSYENPSEELLSEWEEMDWEEIPEEKIILEVQKIRTANPTAEVSQMSARKKFNLSENDFFIIVDTNVLLSNIEFLKEIKGKMYKGENLQIVHHKIILISQFQTSEKPLFFFLTSFYANSIDSKCTMKKWPDSPAAPSPSSTNVSTQKIHFSSVKVPWKVYKSRSFRLTQETTRFSIAAFRSRRPQKRLFCSQTTRIFGTKRS